MKPYDVSPRTEQAVLGGMMKDPSCAFDVLSELVAEDFYIAVHQDIFRCISECVDRGEVPGMNIVFEQAQRAERKSVSASYIFDCFEECVSLVPVPGLVREIRESSLKRQLDLTLAGLLDTVQHENSTFDDLVSQVESEIFKLADKPKAKPSQTLSKALAGSLERYDTITRRGLGLRTGFADLDRVMGGMKPSELILLAARPSIGKTSLACEIIKRVAQQGKSVFFSTLEQDAVSIADRFLCAEGKIDSQRWRLGRMNEQEMDNAIEARAKLENLRVFLDDAPHQNIWRIMANARRHKLKDKIQLVVIDYIQLIKPHDTRVNRNEQVATISRGIKAIARELEIPVLALCQLNRGSEHADRRPRMFDLRDSGQLEQDADVIALMHRDEEDSNTIEVIVEKNRNGLRGVVEFAFVGKHFSFFDMPEPKAIFSV